MFLISHPIYFSSDIKAKYAPTDPQQESLTTPLRDVNIAIHKITEYSLRCKYNFHLLDIVYMEHEYIKTIASLIFVYYLEDMHNT